MAFLNSQMIEGKIATCGQIIGYSFANTLLVLEALNMSGGRVYFQQESMPVPKNTRMAVYGDSAAEFNLCARWVRTTLTKGNVALLFFRLEQLLVTDDIYRSMDVDA